MSLDKIGHAFRFGKTELSENPTRTGLSEAFLALNRGSAYLEQHVGKPVKVRLTDAGKIDERHARCPALPEILGMPPFRNRVRAALTLLLNRGTKDSDTEPIAARHPL